MKAIIIGIDYIPSNDDIKLLEINTNTLMGGYSQIHLTFDFSQLAKYCSDHSIKNVTIHQLSHDRVIHDWEGNPVYMFDDRVKFKLDEELNKYGIISSTFHIHENYPEPLDFDDHDDVLNLRQAFTNYSKIDWFAISKDRLRTFLKSMGNEMWMPNEGIDNISISPPNIPDYVSKIPDMDAQTGIRFFEKTDYVPENGIIEDYCVPDNDEWGFFNEVRYTCVLTDRGDIIPLTTDKTVPLNRFTFKQANINDYGQKELRLVYKMPSFGIISKNTSIQTLNGSLSPYDIHLRSLSGKYETIVSYKINDIDMGLVEHQVYEKRTNELTSLTDISLTYGTNNFIFIPKATENCIAVNGTILSPRAILPVYDYGAGNVNLIQTKNLSVGDICLDGNLNPKPILSIENVGLQELLYPQPINDMRYHRSIVCDDMLVVCESQFFDALVPNTTRSSKYIVGSSLLDRELSMLNYNVKHGTLYDWGKNRMLAENRTNKLLNLICDKFWDEIWTW